MDENSAATPDSLAAEALHWVVRRMDGKTWTEAAELQFQAWRKVSSEHDREFARHESVARMLSQPQAHRDVVSCDFTPARKTAEMDQPAGDNPRLAEAMECLQHAFRAERSPQAAIVLLDAAISRLGLLAADDEGRCRLSLARALMRRAQMRRKLGAKQPIAAILKDYDEAETQLILALPDRTPSWREDLADVCAQRGVVLSSCDTPGGFAQAIVCFDRAIELLRPLLPSGQLWSRYSLVAAWMGRGDALSRLGGEAHGEQALAAYAEAFALMRGVVLTEEPLFRRRFVVACLNRSSLLLQRNRGGDAELAAGCCDEALVVLHGAPGRQPVEKILMASVWANRAVAFSRLSPGEAGAVVRESSRTALDLVVELEANDPRAAQAGLTARHALCVTIAKLVADRIDPEFRAALVAEALESVGDALRVARATGMNRGGQTLSLANELFIFGGKISEQFRPHLLGSFLLTHLQAAYAVTDEAWREELRGLALGLVDEAIQNILTKRLGAGATPALSDYYLDSLKALREARLMLRQK